MLFHSCPNTFVNITLGCVFCMQTSNDSLCNLRSFLNSLTKLFQFNLQKVPYSAFLPYWQRKTLYSQQRPFKRDVKTHLGSYPLAVGCFFIELACRFAACISTIQPCMLKLVFTFTLHLVSCESGCVLQWINKAIESSNWITVCSSSTKWSDQPYLRDFTVITDLQSSVMVLSKSEKCNWSHLDSFWLIYPGAIINIWSALGYILKYVFDFLAIELETDSQYFFTTHLLISAKEPEWNWTWRKNLTWCSYA